MFTEHSGLALEKARKLHKFKELRDVVAQKHALNYPDQVVEMSALRILEGMHVEVPKVGVFSMTDWAEKQMGSMLGVQWAKWFDPKLVTNSQVQEELNRRFSKTGATMKLRTARFPKGAPGVPGCDGSLRAILSPTYYAIDDERIFDRLEKSFGSKASELNFLQHYGGNRWGTDHSQYYTVVGAGVNIGELELNSSDQEVKDAYAKAGGSDVLGNEDWVYQGFNIRNSEVGFTAVIVDEFFLRLVCNNGAMVTSGGGRLMYRMHRPIEDSEMDKMLGQVFEGAPNAWRKTSSQLIAMKAAGLAHPQDELDKALNALEATKKFRDLAQEKFKLEPLPSVWGVFNAITRAARESDDMDKKVEMEELAGQFLHKHAPRLAPIIH